MSSRVLAVFIVHKAQPPWALQHSPRPRPTQINGLSCSLFKWTCLPVFSLYHVRASQLHRWQEAACSFSFSYLSFLKLVNSYHFINCNVTVKNRVLESGCWDPYPGYTVLAGTGYFISLSFNFLICRTVVVFPPRVAVMIQRIIHVKPERTVRSQQNALGQSWQPEQ